MSSIELSIQCPVLFITGEHDQFAVEEKVKRLASLVDQNGRYTYVQNTGFVKKSNRKDRWNRF